MPPGVGSGQRAASRAASGLRGPQLGEAEVEHFDAARRRHHDVPRLEVAVGDATLVRGGERRRRGDGDLEEEAQLETGWRDEPIGGLPPDGSAEYTAVMVTSSSIVNTSLSASVP